MQFAFSDEQDQFRDAVRRFLTDRSPIAEVRRLSETTSGFDDDVWRVLVGELGLLGVHARVEKVSGLFFPAGFNPVEINKPGTFSHHVH